MDDATARSGFTVLAFSCYVNDGSYDYLTSALQLVSGAHTTVGGTYNTAHGELVLINSPKSVNFQITEANTTAPPEPSSLVLLGSRALGIWTVLRRRHLV